MGTVTSRDSKSGSALLIVLGVMAILSLLVAEFGRGLRADLRASGGFYEEAQNDQLARSALAAAQIELLAVGASMYADPTGNVYFVTSDETAESEIAALAQYRLGQPLGRGSFSYRFVMKPYALDINELSADALGRLFEVACGLEEGDERLALVDAILDWTDSDNVARAYGAEEDFYKALVPPRHCRNAPFETVEELFLVNGITPDMLFGYGLPAHIEDGILMGGGLYRFLIGDNCPEAQASVQYILRGIFPSDDQGKKDVEVVSGFQKVAELPSVLYLVAEGFVPSAAGDKEAPALGAEESAPADAASRHIILVKLAVSKSTQNAGYTIDDFQENAAGELLEQVLVYGVPEETNEL
ncbi:MAG: hypothetical protein WCH86_00215 [Kiritimatiellales bacterium]